MWASKALDLRFEVDEAGGVRMNGDDKAIVLSAYLRDVADATDEARPFGLAHLFGLIGTPCRRRAAGRDRVDQHEMARAMRAQRAAGADRGVSHLIPFRGIVEGAEYDAADRASSRAQRVRRPGRPDPPA